MARHYTVRRLYGTVLHCIDDYIMHAAPTSDEARPTPYAVGLPAVGTGGNHLAPSLVAHELTLLSPTCACISGHIVRGKHTALAVALLLPNSHTCHLAQYTDTTCRCTRMTLDPECRSLVPSAAAPARPLQPPHTCRPRRRGLFFSSPHHSRPTRVLRGTTSLARGLCGGGEGHE